MKLILRGNIYKASFAVLWLLGFANIACNITNAQILDSYAEVLISPRYNDEGHLEITCNDTNLAQKRLIVTALRFEMTSPGYEERIKNTPFFLGWYIDNAKPAKELWVGVELMPGVGTGTVSFMLPAMLRSPSAFNDEMLLSITTDQPNLSDYFNPTNGTVVYAPVTKVTLECQDDGLRILEYVGWEKEGLEKLVWRSSGNVGPVLEAKFSRMSRIDSILAAIGGAFGVFMFGLFITHYILRVLSSRRALWILLGVSVIGIALICWKLRWIGYSYSFLGIAFGAGVVVGALTKKRFVDVVYQATNPSPGSEEKETITTP